MIYRNGSDIIGFYRGTLPVIGFYRGKALLWQIVKSCFGKGYWVSGLPWISDDAWIK